MAQGLFLSISSIVYPGKIFGFAVKGQLHLFGSVCVHGTGIISYRPAASHNDRMGFLRDIVEKPFSPRPRGNVDDGPATVRTMGIGIFRLMIATLLFFLLDSMTPFSCMSYTTLLPPPGHEPSRHQQRLPIHRHGRVVC
ncbi:MAG: hypothetical protein JXA20_13800 [Spirochaetes bacterium]|nr:hypothetical protein [Spirochaetota bacterium]